MSENQSVKEQSSGSQPSSGKKAVVYYESPSGTSSKLTVPLEWAQDFEQLKKQFWPNRIVTVWEEA